MFTDIDSYIEIIITSKLSPEQLLFCYLLDRNRLDLMYKFVNNYRKFDYKDVKDIVSKGYLFDTNKIKAKTNYDEGYPEKYLVTSSFRELLLTNTDELLEELYELYPVFISVNGVKYPAKQVDVLKLSSVYAKNIKNNLEKHIRILELVKWGKDNLLINTGFEKFIVGKGWEFLEELKKDNNNNTNKDITYDL